MARNIRAACGCSHDSSAAGSPTYGTTGTVTSWTAPELRLFMLFAMRSMVDRSRP